MWLINIFLWESVNRSNYHRSTFPEFQRHSSGYNLNQRLIWFTASVSVVYNSYVKSVVKYQQRVLDPSWHIYRYCLCTLPSRLSFKMSNSSLEPSSWVQWFSLIYPRCVFSHSSKTLLSDQDAFFRTIAHHLHNIFVKIYILLNFSSKDDCNIWLYLQI